MFSCCWVENSCSDRAWSVCMWEGVRGECAWHTWKREGEGRRRAIRGGWATVQRDSEGLAGGKAAFVRSQPPQQLPPTWQTLWEKIHPACIKLMKSLVFFRKCTLKSFTSSATLIHPITSFSTWVRVDRVNSGAYPAPRSTVFLDTPPVKVKRAHWLAGHLQH